MAAGVPSLWITTRPSVRHLALSVALHGLSLAGLLWLSRAWPVVLGLAPLWLASLGLDFGRWRQRRRVPRVLRFHNGGLVLRHGEREQVFRLRRGLWLTQRWLVFEIAPVCVAAGARRRLRTVLAREHVVVHRGQLAPDDYAALRRHLKQITGGGTPHA